MVWEVSGGGKDRGMIPDMLLFQEGDYDFKNVGRGIGGDVYPRVYRRG